METGSGKVPVLHFTPSTVSLNPPPHSRSFPPPLLFCFSSIRLLFPKRETHLAFFFFFPRAASRLACLCDSTSPGGGRQPVIFYPVGKRGGGGTAVAGDGLRRIQPDGGRRPMDWKQREGRARHHLTSRHIWPHLYPSTECDSGPQLLFFTHFWKESNLISLSETMPSHVFKFVIFF